MKLWRGRRRPFAKIAGVPTRIRSKQPGDELGYSCLWCDTEGRRFDVRRRPSKSLEHAQLRPAPPARHRPASGAAGITVSFDTPLRSAIRVFLGIVSGRAETGEVGDG